MFAFLTAPIGRHLLIVLAILAAFGGTWLHGRHYQHELDAGEHAEELNRLAAENLARERAAGLVAQQVGQAHGEAIQQINGDAQRLRDQLRAAKLTASITTSRECPNGNAAQKPAGPDLVDVDDLVFGVDYLRLWNDAYRRPGAGLPGPGSAPGAVPRPAAPPAGPPRGDQSARAAGPARAGSGGL